MAKLLLLVAGFAWGEIYANYILRRNEEMPFLFQESSYGRCKLCTKITSKKYGMGFEISNANILSLLQMTG